MPVVEELKRGKKVKVAEAIAAPVIEQAPVEDGIEKPKTKRPMTEVQKANLAKGRAARAAKLTGRPAAEPEPPQEEPQQPKQKKAPKIVYEEEEEDSEPEVVIVKKKKAPAKKPARVVFEEESEDEPEPVKPKKKTAPRKAKAEPKEQPAEKPVRHVEIRQPMGFLRFV